VEVIIHRGGVKKASGVVVAKQLKFFDGLFWISRRK
jgi:hypothetical protein